MAIQRVGDFLEDTDLDGVLSIGIETNNLSNCVHEVKKRNAKGVFGSPSFGFKQDNLNFLTDLPYLEKIWFTEVNLIDIQGIYALKRLKHFGVLPKRPGIDFSQLSNLEVLIWQFTEKDSGLEKLQNLKVFHTWHVNPKSKNMGEIVMPPSVIELQINWANPTSLDGMPTMPNLKHLEIHRCRNLETIDAIIDIAPNLEFLVVTGCGKISGADTVVNKIPNLRHAYVHNKLLISSFKNV